jgi:hypothetical protein
MALRKAFPTRVECAAYANTTPMKGGTLPRRTGWVPFLYYENERP